MFNNLFPKIVNLCNNVEKYGGDREAAYRNMAVRCILDKATRAALAHASVCAPTPTHTHFARAHTHAQKYARLIAFPQH